MGQSWIIFIYWEGGERGGGRKGDNHPGSKSWREFFFFPPTNIFLLSVCLVCCSRVCVDIWCCVGKLHLLCVCFVCTGMYVCVCKKKKKSPSTIIMICFYYYFPCRHKKKKDFSARSHPRKFQKSCCGECWFVLIDYTRRLRCHPR